MEPTAGVEKDAHQLGNHKLINGNTPIYYIYKLLLVNAYHGEYSG